MGEDLLTLDQFITQEKNRIKKNVKKSIKKEYNKNPIYNSKKKISFNDFAKTDEYKEKLQNILNNNKEYQRLFSDDIKNNKYFLDRYHQKCKKLYETYLKEMEEKRLEEEAKQRTIEFEDYLDNDKDVNKLLENVYDDIEVQYKEDIINYLRTSDSIQTQYYPFDHRYKFYERDNKLNETTFDYFKECVNDNYWIENLLEDGLEQGSVETFALAVEMLSKDKKFNEFKMYADDNWDFHSAFIDIITMWVDDPYGEMVYNLENYFDVEKIINNLRLNENYKDMFEKIDNKEIC